MILFQDVLLNLGTKYSIKITNIYLFTVKDKI